MTCRLGVKNSSSLASFAKSRGSKKTLGPDFLRTGWLDALRAARERSPRTGAESQGLRGARAGEREGGKLGEKDSLPCPVR